MRKYPYKNTRINGKIHLLHRVIVANAWRCEPTDIKGIVHHRNGDVQDNRLKNLEIMSLKKHISLHQKGIKKSLEHIAKLPQNQKGFGLGRKGISMKREENGNCKGGIFIDNKKEYRQQYYLLHKKN